MQLSKICSAGFYICALLSALLPCRLPGAPGIEVDGISYGKSQDIIFSAPGGIFYDRRRGEIYVTDSGSSSVLVFGPGGDFLYSFTHCVPAQERGAAGEPRDIVVDSRGIMYLTDVLSQEISILNTRGVKVGSISPGDFEDFHGKQIYPQYMAIDDRDTLFVTLDGDAKEILVLDPEQRLVRRLFGAGEGFGVLTGISLDRDGNLMVTDIGGGFCVQVYSRGGAFLRGFGKKAIGDENFSHPHGLAATADGDIWVVDSFRQVLKRFSKEGRYKEMVGGFGIGPGDLRYPVDIASDLDRIIIVVEKIGRRFQILRVK